MKFQTILFTLLISLSLLLAACGSADVPAPIEEAPQEETAPAEEPAVEEEPAAIIALRVTGEVANEQAWTEDEVKAMNTIEAESENSQGETSQYTGVPLADLLAAAQANADATIVVFVADDGFTAEVSMEELTACTDCIASFRNNGGFSIVMPGFPGSLQVKGVIEIQVK